MNLPEPRGPLSEFLFGHLAGAPHPLRQAPEPSGDALGGDDLHVALYARYELHYRGFDGVDEGWEWEPSLVALTQVLEHAFQRRLRCEVGADGTRVPEDVARELRELLDAVEGPSVSRHLERCAGIDEFREFAVHRSAYQLKEADPHSWVIPRMAGRAKAALVEIQADEYGGGQPARMHARLFGEAMKAIGLDGRYGAYLDAIPGPTLATVNLISMFGLHRRWRGAAMGHLAALEMDSTVPNRRYGNGLRRLGFEGAATDFFDEHVEADAMHENVAAHDLAGSLALDDPEVAADILFGARAMVLLDERQSRWLLGSWQAGRSSLRRPLGAPVTA